MSVGQYFFLATDRHGPARIVFLAIRESGIHPWPFLIACEILAVPFDW